MNEEALGNFVSNIISFCPPIGRSVGRSIGSVVFQSVINSFAWSPGRLVARSLGRFLVSRLFGLSFVHSSKSSLFPRFFVHLFRCSFMRA